MTEIYDYLRLLYARIGASYPYLRQEISQQTVDQMADAIMELPEGNEIQLLAPVVREGRANTRSSSTMPGKRLVRMRIDGEVRDINEEIVLEKT